MMVCYVKIVIISFILIINFIKITTAESIPDMSNLDYETRSSIKIACVTAKYNGPAPYAKCVQKHLRSIGIKNK